MLIVALPHLRTTSRILDAVEWLNVFCEACDIVIVVIAAVPRDFVSCFQLFILSSELVHAIIHYSCIIMLIYDNNNIAMSAVVWNKICYW